MVINWVSWIQNFIFEKSKYQELITPIKTQPCHLLGYYISFGGSTENCNISSAYSEEQVHFYSIIRTSILKS